ncbi:MAG TPA: hypothetical protein VMJ49_03420 [Gaiellaceae bacterium]|nr:hypothetical protein [Gaiellaceae bacterium]
MIVRFVKRRGRRYGVYVDRDRAPALRIEPAPGYDDDLPHDLLHFVAEAEFGLDDGVFGDLAAGGNARIFEPVDSSLARKMWREKRRRKHTLPDGRRSEVLAHALATAWRTRRGSDAELERLLPMLDELAARWRGLRPGESIELTWPRPEARRYPATRDARDRRGAPRASAGAPGRRAARS